MNNYTTNPFKIFLTMLITILMLSVFENTKISNWENSSPQNNFRDFTLSFLNLLSKYNFLNNVKIDNYEKYVSDSEYQNSEDIAIKQIDKNLFIKKISPPYKALIVGDSFMAGSLGMEIQRSLSLYKDFTVIKEAKSSTGLSRPDYYDWNEKIKELISLNKPNIVIIMFGANDAQNIPMQDNNGFIYGTNLWDKEYGKRVYSFLKILKENNIFVVWIGNPIARDIGYSNRMSHLNSLYKKETTKFFNSEFLETWDMLSDSNGQYTDYLIDTNNQTRLAREPDGIHVNSFGGKIVADSIVKQLSNYFEMSLK